jgi:hypothetical protein
MQALIYEDGIYYSPVHYPNLTDEQLGNALRELRDLLVSLQREEAHREYQRIEKQERESA